MYEQFVEQGVDITKEPMKVSPTAHYGMGGIEVDPRTCATAVVGLFAVGESTAGVHGANRLGGNSLAETVVFGKILGTHLADVLDDLLTRVPLDEGAAQEHFAALDVLAAGTGGGEQDPEELIDELRDLVWDYAGIVRTGDGLRKGIEKLRDLKERAGELAISDAPPSRRSEHVLNLRAMLTAAEAVMRGALAREESRGAHYREDFPEEADGWQKNILCAGDEGGDMHLWTEPVGEVSAEIRKALDEDYSLDYHYLE
jgi:succinate dehydrogenase / fumarate reductase flavoprotein subunit